jgi:hypothetical protein
MNNRTYVIIDSSEVDGVDFNQVMQTSSDKLRYSLDGSKALLKYEGDQPSFLNGKTEYTHSEILTILDGTEWTSLDQTI